jgi:SlyX protein
MNEEALEQIQTKIAFLERANAELSDALIRQQREIRALMTQMREISERLAVVQSANEDASPQDERPPHY